MNVSVVTHLASCAVSGRDGPCLAAIRAALVFGIPRTFDKSLSIDIPKTSSRADAVFGLTLLLENRPVSSDDKCPWLNPMRLLSSVCVIPRCLRIMTSHFIAGYLLDMVRLSGNYRCRCTPIVCEGFLTLSNKQFIKIGRYGGFR